MIHTEASGEPSVGGSRSATAFVGRQRERAELRAALDEATAGRGQLVILTGDPGIGKPRLADHVAFEAATQGAQVAWGAMLGTRRSTGVLAMDSDHSELYQKR